MKKLDPVSPHMPIIDLWDMLFPGAFTFMCVWLLLVSVIFWQRNVFLAFLSIAIGAWGLYKITPRLVLDIRLYRRRHEIARVRKEYMEACEREIQSLDEPERSRRFADQLDEILNYKL